MIFTKSQKVLLYLDILKFCANRKKKLEERI